MRYEIEEIYCNNGMPAKDELSRDNVGRIVRILALELGKPMIIGFYKAELENAAIATSKVREIAALEGGHLRVMTGNHIYILKELEE